MTAGKQKNTPVIVMKKKRHIISPSPIEEHVITPLSPELPSGTVENEIPAHQTKKTENGRRNSSTPVSKRFPLLHAEEGGFRPLKIGITRDFSRGFAFC